MATMLTAAICVMMPPIAEAQGEDANQALDSLPTTTAVPANYTYNRDSFGWNNHDTNSNGCRTRDDVLARDLDDVQKKDKCVVESGMLDDPYTAKEISFQRGTGTSTAVQIDHVVALRDAWDSGAYQWPNDRKQLFANDPYVLAAVDGPANQTKSDGSADEWLPTNSAARCPYVELQIGIKKKYDLSVTDAERDTMKSVLRTCGANPTIPEDSPNTSLVRIVEATENKPTAAPEKKTGFPFGAKALLTNDGKKYEYRGMTNILRQDLAAFLYRWAGSPAFTPSAADKRSFRDVNDKTPHAKEIWWMAKQGITTGWDTPRGKEFRGTDTVKRQDMAAFMKRLVGDYGPAEKSSGIQFNDVDGATPHYDDIMWLAKTGVSEGWTVNGRREFRGMDTVKRQDMAAFLYRLAGKPASEVASHAWVKSRYVDVNDKTPHANDIYWLTLHKISEGWVYVAPKPKPTPKPKPKPSPKPTQKPSTPTNVYYKNCAAVRAAGKAPLHRGQPGYRPGLDRDGDGVACE